MDIMVSGVVSIGMVLLFQYVIVTILRTRAVL